jgi:hypothetical protein
MSASEQIEPVLDYFTKFHYSFLIGNKDNFPQYRDLDFYQRLGMWTGVTAVTLCAVVLGMIFAGTICFFVYALWTTAPGVVLFLTIMGVLITLLSWKVKL